MLEIRLQGNRRRMGETVGRSYPLAIWRVAAENMRRYHTATCDVERLNRALDRRVEQLRELLPEAYEYLKGIEEGSSVPIRKLILFNCGLAPEDRETIVEGFEPAEQQSGCTIAAFQNTPLGPVIGGNLDDPEWQFLAFEAPDRGYRALKVRLPGYYQSWGGMNEHGLCITGASGGPALPGTPDAETNPGAPAMTTNVVGDILHTCRTVEEAVELMRAPLYDGNNYMLGDPDNAVQVEKRYDGVTVTTFREPDDAPLCAGNLRRSDFGQPWYEKHLEELPPDKLGRHRLVLEMMDRHRDSPGVESLKAVLNAHGAGKTDVESCKSLCHFGSALTLIGIPSEKRTLIGEAPACVNGYAEYRMDQVLRD